METSRHTTSLLIGAACAATALVASACSAGVADPAEAAASEAPSCPESEGVGALDANTSCAAWSYWPAERAGSRGGLRAFVRKESFSGSWHDLELSFRASVAPGSVLRVGIVPAELVPIELAAAALAAGSDAALVSVTLDATYSPTTFAIDAGAIRVSEELKESPLGCTAANDACADPLEVSVVRELDKILARVTDGNGESLELRAPAPRSASLRPSRLVVWQSPVELDDRLPIGCVRLSAALRPSALRSETTR